MARTSGGTGNASQDAGNAGVPEAGEAVPEEAGDGQDRSGRGAGDAGEESAFPETEAGEVLSLTLDNVQVPSSETASPSRRGGRRPGAGRKPGNASSTPATPARAPRRAGVGREAAGGIIALTEGGLFMAMQDSRVLMTPDEKAKIAEPLGNILERMSPEAAALVANFADPIALGVAAGAYLTRIFTLPPKNPPQRTPAASQRPQPTHPAITVPDMPSGPVGTPTDGGPPAQPVIDGVLNADARLFAD